MAHRSHTSKMEIGDVDELLEKTIFMVGQVNVSCLILLNAQRDITKERPIMALTLFLSLLNQDNLKICKCLSCKTN